MLLLLFFKQPQCVDLMTPRPPFLFFAVRLLTEGATLQITWCFHKFCDGTRIIPEARLWAYVEGIFSIRLSEVRRSTLNAGSNFSGWPDLKRPNGNALLLLACLHILVVRSPTQLVLLLSCLPLVLHQSLSGALQESSRPLA